MRGRNHDKKLALIFAIASWLPMFQQTQSLEKKKPLQAGAAKDRD
jgi:hypothetical protein